MAEKTVNTETSNTNVIAGINLDNLSDTDMALLIKQAKSRAEAKAPVVLAEIAEIKAEIEALTERLKVHYEWCHANGIRIPRVKPDGTTDPDSNADENPVKRSPGRPKKEAKG